MKVLVVDDDEDTVVLLSMLMERHGLVVDTVSTFAEALEALDAGDYHVVVTDLNMPDGDGMSLLAQAKPKTPLLGAILVTGAETVEQREAIKQIGFTHCFTKPVDSARIIAAIDSLAAASAHR